MIVPPLSQFICSTPQRLVSDVPTLWLEACLAGGTDCIVLVNVDEVPVGIVPLHQLLKLVDAGVMGTTARPNMSPTGPLTATEQTAETPEVSLRDVCNVGVTASPVVPILLITVNTPLATAVQVVAKTPEPYWIVTDQQQRYLGLLDKTRLLAAAFLQPSLEPDERAAIATTSSLEESVLEESVLEQATNPESDRPSQQALSQSNTALLTYLGHELKTPLTSLLGLSSLLKTGRIGELNARQNRYVSLIQQHSRRLAAWVNTLIDLGRIESGTLRLIPTLVNLAPIWREAYHQAALRVGQEEAQVPALPSLLSNDSAPITLVADPSRLQQMLICLMQTALAQVIIHSPDITPPLLRLEVWENWLAFISPEFDTDLYPGEFSQSTFSLPFPTTSAASTPLAGEMGHWLEWLLVRKLAQLHGGELALMTDSFQKTCPTLLLPTTPGPRAIRDSRFLLLVAPDPGDSIKGLQQQASQLNYRLLITHQIKDAVEIASHLPLFAILVLVHGYQSVHELSYLQAQMDGMETLVIALVRTQWSALMGDLAADRELLWPANSLGSVLFQSPSATPAPNRLTVLYLKSNQTDPESALPKLVKGLELPHIFHDFGCRVLEVDSLEQAELLKRVWHPNVAVLDPTIIDPIAYLATFSQSPALLSLPLMTLTMATTQAAHKIAALAVFPCLVGETPWDTPDVRDRMTAWLIQVLQVAATHSG
ncbi:MAG: histidine kinase dimerization/phospho-acceptor domain-containing protein [Cyanobacteria bacterium P01_F01_bin.86]